jgi:hypothetical protein
MRPLQEPKWDATVRGYALDFGGRVTHPSIKNFQLSSEVRIWGGLGLGRQRPA